MAPPPRCCCGRQQWRGVRSARRDNASRRRSRGGLTRRADIDKKIKESDESNNLLKGERFTIIARQWNVTDFETIVTDPGAAASTTMAGAGFQLEFSYYDHAGEQSATSRTS